MVIIFIKNGNNRSVTLKN